jgi:arginine exporter protein ArgO
MFRSLKGRGLISAFLTIILWIFTLFCMGLAVLSLFSEATVLLFSVIVFWVVVSVFLWWLAWLSDKRRPRKPKQPKPIPDQEIVQETLTEEKIENVVPPQDPSRSVPEGKSYSLLMVFILLII